MEAVDSFAGVCAKPDATDKQIIASKRKMLRGILIADTPGERRVIAREEEVELPSNRKG
jgi:hypothetical protein